MLGLEGHMPKGTLGGYTSEGERGSGQSPELHLIVPKGLVQSSQHTGSAFLAHRASGLMPPSEYQVK